jgi:hypothetical protein
VIELYVLHSYANGVNHSVATAVYSRFKYYAVRHHVDWSLVTDVLEDLL